MTKAEQIQKTEKSQIESYQAYLRWQDNNALLSYADIGIMTGYATTTVQNSVSKRPGFPSPSYGNKFKSSQVKRYFNQAASLSRQQ